MKKLVLMAFCMQIILSAGAQGSGTKVDQPDSTKKIQVVEASCGECQFHMSGKGCHLAVRIDGKTYFVDGTGLDDHGDAHAADGFCEAIKKAEVQGEIINNRYKVSYFKLTKPEVQKDIKTKKSG
jgi:hypothetical protein